MNESLKIKGEVELVLTDLHGNVKETRVENLVVSAGIAFIASRIKDATSTLMNNMAIGTNATAANAAQTALITEIARVSVSSPTLVTTNVTNDSLQYVGTFPAGTGTGAIVEAGILNAASAGTMLSRTVFSVINKSASDSLTITWKIIVA